MSHIKCVIINHLGTELRCSDYEKVLHFSSEGHAWVAKALRFQTDHWKCGKRGVIMLGHSKRHLFIFVSG